MVDADRRKEEKVIGIEEKGTKGEGESKENGQILAKVSFQFARRVVLRRRSIPFLVSVR